MFVRECVEEDHFCVPNLNPYCCTGNMHCKEADDSSFKCSSGHDPVHPKDCTPAGSKPPGSGCNFKLCCYYDKDGNICTGDSPVCNRGCDKTGKCSTLVNP